MKRQPIYLIIAVAFLLAFVAMTASAQDVDKLKYPKLNKLKIPKIERVTLNNGMRLYIVEDRELPVFNVSVRINAGSFLEDPEKIGLVSLVGQVLRTGGTRKWSGDEIDEALEAVGATVETRGGLTNCGAYVNALSEHTNLSLEVLAEILRHPVFAEDKINLANVQQRSTISRRNDNPQNIGRREFNKIIYGAESVFARHTEYKTIDAITRDDLVEYHSIYIRPENTQMAIWGDFKKKEIIARIEQYFGDWERGATPVPPLPEVDYNFESKVYFVNKTDVNQSNIYIGHIGGLVTDEDYAARIVMNKIMGGGLGNRMFNAVRSREGLAYSARGVYGAHISYPGVFYNFAATKSETTGKAIREIIKVIESMQTDPPTEEEMRRAKESYLNSFVFNFDTKREIVNRIMYYDFYGLPDDYLQQEKERIEKVTAEDVVTAAKKNLHPDNLDILVVGKVEDFELPLDQLELGPVTEIDITIPSGEEKHELEITPENLAKGKDILDKAVVAHGGLENYKKVKSIITRGTFTITTPQGGFPVNFEEITVFPDRHSQIVTVMGRKMYDIRDGSSGWKTSPRTMEIVPKTDKDIADDARQATRNTILVFQQSVDPDYQPVYGGTGTVNGSDVEFVTLVDQEGETICRFGFSIASHELVCKYYWGESPMGEGNIEELFSGYSEIDGIRIPLTIVRNMNGQKIGELTHSEFLINTEIPANSFAPPE